MSLPQPAAARRLLTAGCLALAALLAACTTPAPSPGVGTPGARAGTHRPGAGAAARGAGLAGTGRPQITVGQIPATSSRQPVVLPLEAYEQIASLEQDTGIAAFGLLVQRCMQAKGFSYDVAPQPSESLAELRAVENQPAGLTSLAQAKAHGYGKPGKLYVPSGREGLSVFSLDLPRGMSMKALSKHPAWASALLGGDAPGAPPSAWRQRGCYQSVQAQLTHRTSRLTDPVPALAAQAAQWAQSDPRVLATQRAWSKCMAARGYRYQTPLEPVTHHWPKKPTPVEIATATADVTCKTWVNLPHTVLAIEAAYQRALLAQNPAAFTHLQTGFRSLLQKAENLLGARPGALKAGRFTKAIPTTAARQMPTTWGTGGPGCPGRCGEAMVMARERAATELERFLAERAGPACGGESDRQHWVDVRSR
jgi:hypothetical protein